MAKRISWHVRLALEDTEKKAVEGLAKAELRSTSNMVVVLLREALANRMNENKP